MEKSQLDTEIEERFQEEKEAERYFIESEQPKGKKALIIVLSFIMLLGGLSLLIYLFI